MLNVGYAIISSDGAENARARGDRGTEERLTRRSPRLWAHFWHVGQFFKICSYALVLFVLLCTRSYHHIVQPTRVCAETEEKMTRRSHTLLSHFWHVGQFFKMYCYAAVLFVLLCTRSYHKMVQLMRVRAGTEEKMTRRSPKLWAHFWTLGQFFKICNYTLVLC